MSDFPVKWFSSDMGGAPVLSDKTPGEMIALTKACLSTGFNLMPIDGMEFDSGTGLATVNLSTGHGFLPWQVIEISGADQAGYNGEHRVVSVGSGWLTFAPDAAPSAGAATGDSMEIKASPSKSWEFIDEDAATYQASFRSTAPSATDHVVVMTDDDPTISSQVDSSADAVNLAIAENYQDLSSFDEVANQWWPASHRYWSESYERYSYSKKGWMLIASERLIYFIIGYGGSSKRSAFVVGNFDSVRPADGYNFMISGFRAATGWSSSGYGCYSDFARSSESNKEYYRRIVRPYNQTPGDTRYKFLKYSWESIGGAFMAPNPADNGFYISSGRVSITENGGVENNSGMEVLRGYMPGLVEPLNTIPYYDLAILDDLPGVEGRPIVFCLVSADDQGGYDSEDFTQWRSSQDSHPYLIGFYLDDWSV